jgi:hypothetical protein
MPTSLVSLFPSAPRLDEPPTEVIEEKSADSLEILRAVYGSPDMTETIKALVKDNSLTFRALGIHAMAKDHDLPLIIDSYSTIDARAQYAHSIVYRYSNVPMRIVNVRAEEYRGVDNT